MFDNLDELREDLLNRCLMWRSLRDWQAYTADKLESSFTAIKADVVKEEAAKYAKIVSRLEKSVPDNPILATCTNHPDLNHRYSRTEQS